MDRYNSVDDGCLCAGNNNNRRVEALQRLISVLGEGKKGDYIPYRDSKLTQLLQGMSLYLSSFCPPTLVFNIGGFGAPNFNGGSPPKFWTQFLNYTYIRPSELERFPVGRSISEILWRKKKKERNFSSKI